MTEIKKEDPYWVIEVTTVEKFRVQAPTAGDAVLVPRQDPYFVDKVQVRMTRQDYLERDEQ